MTALFDVDTACADCGRTTDHGTCPWCQSRTATQAAHAGMRAASANRDPEWTQRADEWLRTMRGWEIVQPLTADDLIEAIGLPAGSENQIGARFQSWRRAGYIRQAGFVTSKRRTNHGRVLRAWEVIA